MLANNPPQQPFNPFLPQQQEQVQEREQPRIVPENNKGQAFRRAGNACEIIAGTCLNSCIVFTFHLMQVHPIGLLLSVGTAHFYFTATATGEGLNKAASNIMTGASASLAIACSLHEPVGEWWEARQSRAIAYTEIQQMYDPKPEFDIPWVEGGAIAVCFIVLLMILRK